MFKLLKKIFSIISKRDKCFFFGILFLILISSFLDLISVSAIVPIVSLLSASDAGAAIKDNLLLSILSTIFKTTDVSRLVTISLIFLVCLYAIKTAYTIFTNVIINKFTYGFKKRMSTRLIRVYLSMPYEFHHENNSSTLIRKATYDTQIFTDAVNGLLGFLVKSSTALVIIAYLFVTSWIITLIVGTVLLLFSIFIIFILKKRTKRLGETILSLNSNNYKYLSQSFNGVKESKISNTEEFFVKEYEKNIHWINHYTIRRLFYASIPGHSLEFVGILGMSLSMIIVLTFNIGESAMIVQTFAVFVYAVLKLLPCVTEITSYINAFAFYSSSVDSIYNDLQELDKLEVNIENNSIKEPLSFNSEISIQNVSFAYKDEPTKNVLSNVSFNIKKNSFVAICGSSGAGKTTLVDIILGLLKPTSGEVLCDNSDINLNVKGWRNNLSYIPQNIYLTDDTIRNNIAFGIDKKLIDDNKIWDALEKAELKNFVKNSPNGLDTIIGEHGIRLSGGQRQRIGIARAFYRNTNIIVFDEATSALDYETESNILNHIAKYSSDHTLIIITHRLNTIEICDHIYKIEGGELTQTK